MELTQRDKIGLYWNMSVWGTIGTVHELIARLTEQFFQHPVTKLMIFPKQPSREVHLESTTELQIIYFPSPQLANTFYPQYFFTIHLTLGWVHKKERKSEDL